MKRVTYWAVDRILGFRDGDSIRIRLACFQRADEARKLQEEMREEWKVEAKRQAAAVMGAVDVLHVKVPERIVIFDSLDEFKAAMRG